MLNRLTSDDKQTLELWMQDYLRELAPYYGDAPGEDGKYSYRYLPLYFSESDRAAFAIAEGDCTVGFLLVNHVNCGSLTTDYTLAEFSVFPPFRGRGRAEETMNELLKILPGTWQLKYTPQNPAAAALWRRVETKYGGKTVLLPDNEVLLVFDSRRAL